DRSKRLRQPHRHFTLRQAFEVGQFENLALVFGEFGKSLADDSNAIVAQVVGLEIREEPGPFQLLQIATTLSHPGIGGTKVVDGPVASDRQHPGSQTGARIVEAIDPVPDFQKGLLKQILGHAGIANDAYNYRERHLTETIV